MAAAQQKRGIGAAFSYIGAWIAEHWVEILVGAATLIVSTVARFSRLLAPYGALGWIGAGLATLLLLSLAYAVYSWASERAARAEYNRSLTGLTHTINPNATTFENQRVRLADFFHPLSPIHTGKTFRNCTFIGPGAIAFLGKCSIFEPHLNHCDLVAVKSAPIKTAAGFVDSTFHNCQFINVTVFFPEQIVKSILAGMKSDGPVEVIGYNG